MSGGLTLASMITIDALNFEGLSQHEASRAALSFQRELTARLHDPFDVSPITDALELMLPDGAFATPETLGRALADVIHARLCA